MKTNRKLLTGLTSICVFTSLAITVFAQTPGTSKWTYTAQNPITMSAAAIDANGGIYFADWQTTMYALNPDGSQKWKVSTDGYYLGESSPVLSADGTVVYYTVVGRMVYPPGYYGVGFLVEGGVVARSAFDGRYLWQFKIPYNITYNIYNLEKIAVDADGSLYFIAPDGNFYALTSSGALKWVVPNVGGNNGYSAGINSDGTVFVGCGSGNLIGFNPTDGSQKVICHTDGGAVCSPAFGSDGTIYVGGYGGLYAFNPDGSRKWKYSNTLIQAQFPHSGPSIDKNGVIYFDCVGSGTSYNSYLYAINPNGTLKWQFATAEIQSDSSFSSPAIVSDGTIYVGSSTGQKVYAVNSDGSERWEFLTGGKIDSPVAVGSDGTVYVGSMDAKFYAIYGSAPLDSSAVWPKFQKNAYNLASSATVLPGPLLAPQPPTGLAATVGDSQITLNWNASPHAAYYNIKFAVNSGGPYITWTLGSGFFGTVLTDSTLTHCTITGVPNGLTIYFVISAVGAAESANSSEVSAMPEPPPPPAPTGLTATPDNAQVALSWNASSGAASYHVKRSTTSGSGYAVIGSPTGTTFTDTTANNGTTYYYVVSAVNSSGESANSTQVSATPQLPIPAGAVAWWPGEGNANDIIGSHNGALQGGSSFGAGKVGQGFVFDGNSGYVSVPRNDAWAFGNNDFTIELWANFAGQDSDYEEWPYGGVFISSDEGGGNMNKWFFALAGHALNFHINDPVNGPVFLLNTTFTPALHTWYHLAVTRSGNAYTAYVNGVAVGSDTCSRTIPNANAPLMIGQAEGFYFNGSLDEVSIYSRALTASEIQGIYNAGSAGKRPASPTGLAAYPGNMQIGLSWNPSGAATGYNVKRSTTSGGPYTTIASVTGTSYPDATAANGTTYYYVVSTVYSGGESANSIEVSAKPASLYGNAPWGLVSWWGANGNADDLVSGNNGSPVGNLTYAGGVTGQAFALDGSSSYITVPASPSMDVGATGSGITIEGWITEPLNYAHYPGGPIIEWDSSTTAGLQLWANGDWSLWASIKQDPNNSYGLQTPSYAIPNYGYYWNHVAVTYDKQSGMLIIYVNGNAVASKNIGKVTPDTAYPVNIGRRTGEPIGNGYTYAGMIDELCIYNRALSATEIQAVYNAGGTGKYVVPPSLTPTGLTATPGNAQIALSWNPSDNATSYNVKSSTTDGGPYTTIANVTGTTYTDTTAANGTTCFYVVSSVNSDGESANSAEAYATPECTGTVTLQVVNDLNDDLIVCVYDPNGNYVVNGQTAYANGIANFSYTAISGQSYYFQAIHYDDDSGYDYEEYDDSYTPTQLNGIIEVFSDGSVNYSESGGAIGQ